MTDAMLDNEEGIWHDGTVGSGLEGLAERDLILAKTGPFFAILTEIDFY